MEKYFTVLTAFVYLIICAIVTGFGRLYFPENFSPETISFFENYWVLTLGSVFVLLILGIITFGIYLLCIEIYRYIKSLLNK